MTDSEMDRLISLARQANKELKRLNWLWGEVIESARKSKEEEDAMKEQATADI